MPTFHDLFHHKKKTEGTQAVPSSAPSTVSSAPGAVPGAVARPGSAATTPAPVIAPKGSTSSKSEQTSERAPPVGIAHAESVLKDSAAKLEKTFPADVRAKFSLNPIQFSADINVLSQSIEGAIGQILASENVDANQQVLVKAVTNSWVKKAIPYLQTGLNVAEGVVPAPYGLVITGVLFVVAQVKAISDASGKVNDVLEYLSRTVENIGIDANFPHVLGRKQLDEIRAQALYLTASIMDCLAVLVGYVAESSLKKALVTPPDLDGAKAGVQEKAVSYSQTTIKITASLQALALRKGEDHDILEKIWPERKPYSAPKTKDEDNIGQSGDWFLNSAEYKDWVGQGPNTLICTGQAGSGKSHIHSVIYRKLLETPQIGIIFFLFKISNRTQTTTDALRVLLRQLLQQCDEIPESIYSAYSPQSSEPDFDTLLKLLAASLSAFSSTYSRPVFILLDAFDEFKNEKDEGHQRGSFLDAISTVLNSGNVKVFVTSRLPNLDDLLAKFKGAVVKEVETNRDDVEKYLDRQLEGSRLSPELQAAIKEKITAEADQSWFLIITLQTRYVLEVEDASQVRKRLKTLPRDSTEAFKSVIERMNDRYFAGRILGWILHSQRILTMAELQRALAFDVDDLEFHLEDRYDPRSIVDSCGGLVEYRHDTGIVTFSHALVQQYLTDHPLDELVSHSAIALACIVYYRDHAPRFGEVENVAVHDGGEVKAEDKAEDEVEDEFKSGVDKTAEMPLLSYAMEFWNTHSKLAGRDGKVETKILEVFAPSSKRNAFLKITSDDSDEVYPGGPLLCFLIEMRLAEIVMKPLLDVPSIVEMLKDVLDPTNINRGGYMTGGYGNMKPFLMAAREGQLEVASWLLDKGADLYTRDDSGGGDALDQAAQGGNLEVAKWLVEEKGMDVKQGKDGSERILNLFLSAAMGGNVELLKWLADEKKMDVNAVDPIGQNALFFAPFGKGSLDAVKWLVDEKKVGFDCVNQNGTTPLLNAVGCMALDIVKWLVIEKKQTVMEMRTSDGLSALDLVSSARSVEFVKWLVEEQRMDPGAANASGSTALHYAASGDALEVVQFFVVEKGVKVDVVTGKGETPLDLAKRSWAGRRVYKWLKAWMEQH